MHKVIPFTVYLHRARGPSLHAPDTPSIVRRRSPRARLPAILSTLPLPLLIHFPPTSPRSSGHFPPCYSPRFHPLFFLISLPLFLPYLARPPIPILSFRPSPSPQPLILPLSLLSLFSYKLGQASEISFQCTNLALTSQRILLGPSIHIIIFFS